MDKAALTRDVVRALRQVYDPEIPVNIYDLGLIYDITIDCAYGSGRYARGDRRGHRDYV